MTLNVWADFRGPFAEFKLAKHKISQAGQNRSLPWPNIMWANVKNHCTGPDVALHAHAEVVVNRFLNLIDMLFLILWYSCNLISNM